MSLNLNRATLMGRLTKDPEIKTTSNGTQVANFTLKISEQRDDRAGLSETYQRIAVFGKAANLVASFLKEGSPVFVEGEIKAHSWEDANGKRRSMTELFANEIQLFPKSYDPEAVVGVNRVVMIGNVVGDAQMNQTNGGAAYNNFTVAINNPKRKDAQVEWVKAVAFGDQALETSDLKKGSPVFVEGKLRTRSFERDGGRDYSTEVVALNTTRLNFPVRQMDQENTMESAAPGR